MAQEWFIKLQLFIEVFIWINFPILSSSFLQKIESFLFLPIQVPDFLFKGPSLLFFGQRKIIHF